MEKDHSHLDFAVNILGKLGLPLISATLAGCIIIDKVIPVHILLMFTGVVLIMFEHWYTHHRG